MIRFIDSTHTYTSDDNLPWYGVTTIVGCLKEVFDAQAQAPKSSKNRKSKWYGISVEDILAAWKGEGDRSVELGKWYHSKRENELYSREGVYRPDIRNGVKYAPDQKVKEGIYPEFLCYLPSARISGQIDQLEVLSDRFNITDYKTSKEIAMESYTNWEGVKKKMSVPLSHLDDCHINHYSLQLSIYAYIITRHNPHLKVRDLTIEHIIFEEAGRDIWDYPIYWKDDKGDYIVKEIKKIPIEYKKSEVLTLINWMKTNSHKIVKHA